MESHMKTKLQLQIISKISVIFGIATFLSGCWLTYKAFNHPSEEEYVQIKLQNNYIFEVNGTRQESNGMYGPESLVLGCSFLAVFAGSVQILNAWVAISSNSPKKMIERTGNCIIANGFTIVALVISLIVTVVTDPARSYENPTEELRESVLKFFELGKNFFATILAVDILFLFLTILYLSILLRNANARVPTKSYDLTLT